MRRNNRFTILHIRSVATKNFNQLLLEPAMMDLSSYLLQGR